MKGIRELKIEVDRLLRVDNDPRVRAAKELVRQERKPQVEALEKQIEELQDKRPEKKPRWPANTPEAVLKACAAYWSGTTEFATYRIHCWNEKGACTSYPSGGYSNNMGWNPTPACFHFISLTELEYRKPKIVGQDLSGRQSQKVLDATLAERFK